MIRDKLLEIDPLGIGAADAGGGDSVDASRRDAMAALMTALDSCVKGERAFTLRLADPMANTWLYSPFASTGEPDPRLTHETYVRSHQEDAELGLLDMCAPRDED